MDEIREDVKKGILVKAVVVIVGAVVAIVCAVFAIQKREDF